MKLNSPFSKPLTSADIQAAANLRTQFNKRKQELGLTQETAAEKLNISQPSVNKYLNAKIPLNVKAVLAWAGLLQINPLLIREDFESLLAATSKPKSIPLVAILQDNGNCVIQTGKRITMSALNTTQGVHALKLETKDFPGYFYGQIVTFDKDKPGNKDRHSVVMLNDEYCICEYINGKYVNLANREILGGDELTSYNITGTAFVD